MSPLRIERIPDDDSVAPDVLCSEKSVGETEVHASALFRVHHSSGSITVRFEWASDYSARDLDESDLLLIPEAETLFFRTLYQWGSGQRSACRACSTRESDVQAFYRQIRELCSDSR